MNSNLEQECKFSKFHFFINTSIILLYLFKLRLNNSFRPKIDILKLLIAKNSFPINYFLSLREELPQLLRVSIFYCCTSHNFTCVIKTVNPTCSFNCPKQNKVSNNDGWSSSSLKWRWFTVPSHHFVVNLKTLSTVAITLMDQESQVNILRRQWSFIYLEQVSYLARYLVGVRAYNSVIASA